MRPPPPPPYLGLYHSPAPELSRGVAGEHALSRSCTLGHVAPVVAVDQIILADSRELHPPPQFARGRQLPSKVQLSWTPPTEVSQKSKASRLAPTVLGTERHARGPDHVFLQSSNVAMYH
jgi:hypothetical protein